MTWLRQLPQSPYPVVYSVLYSTLDRIEQELRDALSRFEATGYTENEDDARIVARLILDN